MNEDRELNALRKEEGDRVRGVLAVHFVFQGKVFCFAYHVSNVLFQEMSVLIDSLNRLQLATAQHLLSQMTLERREILMFP